MPIKLQELAVKQAINRDVEETRTDEINVRKGGEGYRTVVSIKLKRKGNDWNIKSQIHLNKKGY